MVVYTSTSRHLFGKRLWYCFLRSQLRPLVKPVPNLVLLLFVYINPALLLRLRLRAKTLDLCLFIFRSAIYINRLPFRDKGRPLYWYRWDERGSYPRSESRLPLPVYESSPFIASGVLRILTYQ